MKNYKELIIFHKFANKKKKNLIFYNYKTASNYSSKILKLNFFFLARPYGLSSRQIKLDHRYLFECYKFYLKRLSKNLNILHSTNKNIRYWEIFIGHWLKSFLWTTYNRYKTIHLIKSDYKINKVTIFDTNNINFALSDTFDLNILANDEYFNSLLLSKIIEETNLFKFTLNKNFIGKKNFFIKKKENLKKFFFKKLFNFSSSNVYFTDTYIQSKYNLLLKLFVNKVPSFFLDMKIDVKKKKNTDKKKRNFIHFDLNKKDNFYILISKLMKDFLPMSFIEDYKNIRKEILKKDNLSKKINTIFTCNTFGKGDIINLWIAEKVFEGTKYIVGQHGFGYLEYYDKKSRVEYRTCDKFISWGNRIFSKKIAPLYNFKTWGKNIKINCLKNKNILLITRSSGTQITHYDRWHLGKEIFFKTENLISRIDRNLQKNIILKLHDNYKKKMYPDFDEFIKKQNNLKIKQRVNFFDLLKKNKIVIFNDYSSGFLECLSLDLPTICLFPFKLNFIHSTNHYDFQILKHHNLIFYDEKKLANFINKNYQNIEQWWNSSKIKKVKKNFCIKYSKKSYKSLFKNLKSFSSELH